MTKSFRILVTGFGSFPGARQNPTETLIKLLARHKERLARQGISLDLHVLPVAYKEIPKRLEALFQGRPPDAVLHFGLARRRTQISIETRALNRMSVLHPDASGAQSDRFEIVLGAPFFVKSSFPATQIEAALNRAGLTSRRSIDAGDYICNETLYLSLVSRRARSAGFIHVPPLARRDRPKALLTSKVTRPTLAMLEQAALIAILATARGLRR